SRPGLHGSKREVEVRGDLALRHSAPVSELDHLALPRLEFLEGAVYAPGDLGVLGPLLGARLAGRELGELRVGSWSVAAQPVDDRVPGDRVQPAAGRAAFRPVRRGGAPDRRKRLLNRGLGVAAVAEPPQGEAEDRPDVSTVEDLEGLAVALADARQQLRVGSGVVGRRGLRRDSAQPGLGHLEGNLHIATVLTHLALPRIAALRACAAQPLLVLRLRETPLDLWP